MDIADEIKRRLSMDEVVRRYGFAPKQPGNYICCPFHHEKTPSLKVYSEPGRGWHCFGCGAGGSVIDFAMLLFNIPFSAAVVRLNADFSLGLCNDRPDPRELARLKAERQERENAAAQYEQAYTARCNRRRVLWERLKAMGADDLERDGLERTLAAMDDWFDRNPYCRERGEQH